MPIEPARRVVVALGGNAISRPNEEGTVSQDLANLDASLAGVVGLVERGCSLVITHGNGPQIGNQMIRVEMARGHAPELPLDLMGADLQGGLGYMIERVLRSRFRRRGLSTHTCCLLCMVEVRSDDPSAGNPTKFVGPVVDEGKVATCRARGWVMKEDRGRGWRRVVPSPDPVAVVERDEVLALLERGAVVITAGGGGIPVTRTPSGDLVGFEGVIDKDMASAVLALAVGAPDLYILTEVQCVMMDWGTPQARPLDHLTLAQARRLLAEGQFPPGSMGPKIEAACRFLAAGGQRVLITDIYALKAALAGRTGTWIVPDP
ncbi:MAG: carbamate kinase [Deltaproteobacteria bacterium]|nr:carbamate kinase [Deltaproteobacteria bacterium]